MKNIVLIFSLLALGACCGNCYPPERQTGLPFSADAKPYSPEGINP
ncbi:MAG TPA: hypothetical protein PK803_05795 [Alphaproteobacteria bacterium]|nr:hypothetical protein [Alphaproteobacteria bacterium]